MRRSLVLRVSVDLLFTSILMFSLYLLFAGHNAPGGGFVGGLVTAAGLVLRYAANGVGHVRRDLRLAPPVYLGAGLALAATTGLLPLLAGEEFLKATSGSMTVPAVGAVKLTSALAFDTGVYLVVVGFAYMLLDTFGADPDPRAPSLGEAGR